METFIAFVYLFNAGKRKFFIMNVIINFLIQISPIEFWNFRIFFKKHPVWAFCDISTSVASVAQKLSRIVKIFVLHVCPYSQIEMIFVNFSLNSCKWDNIKIRAKSGQRFQTMWPQYYTFEARVNCWKVVSQNSSHSSGLLACFLELRWNKCF